MVAGIGYLSFFSSLRLNSGGSGLGLRVFGFGPSKGSSIRPMLKRVEMNFLAPSILLVLFHEADGSVGLGNSICIWANATTTMSLNWLEWTISLMNVIWSLLSCFLGSREFILSSYFCGCFNVFGFNIHSGFL